MSILISDFDGTRMRLVDRIAWPWPGMAGRISGLRCWVQPQLRFARGWLAEALSERGERFYPFDRWSQIADQLQKAQC
jgi:hypothetical protein